MHISTKQLNENLKVYISTKQLNENLKVFTQKFCH